MRTRIAVITLAVAAGSVFAAACSSSGGGGDAAAGTSSAGGATGAGVAEARANLEKYRAVPEFKAPGPAFDAKKAVGKKIFYLPVTSTIPYLNYVQSSLKEALGTVGAQLIPYTNQGQPTQWAQGMSSAIAQKADAIVLYDISPSLITPQLQAAKAAGIPVIEKHNLDLTDPLYAQASEKVTAQLPAPYVLAGRLEADQAIVDRNGKANVIILTSSDAQDTHGVVRGINDELRQLCSGCKTTTVDVPFNDWSTKIQPQLQTALNSHHDVNYIIPVFDGMVQWVTPAVTAAGATGRIKVSTYNATPFVMEMLQKKQLISMDVGESYPWLGWALADQALRVVTGTTPVTDDNVPARVFDEGNAADVGSPPDVSKGYGDAFIDGYKKLWGAG